MVTALKQKPIALHVFIVFALLFSLTSYAEAQTCTPPPSGLVGWWTGDVDGSDISGNANHALLQNGALANQTGMVNGGFSFNGVNAIAETTVQLGAQGTIDLWANPAQLTNLHTLIGTFGLANGDDRLWLTTNTTQLFTNLGSNSVDDIIISTPLSVGAWTHLALTFDFDADDYHLFVNGTEIDSTTASRAAPTGVLKFGGIDSDFGQSFFFNGLIDEVEVFNRVLASGEIQAIFDAGSAGKCKDTPFAESTLKKAEVKFDKKGGTNDRFKVEGAFLLGLSNDGINLVTEEMIVTVGPGMITIPAGSFMAVGSQYKFDGELNGVDVKMTIKETHFNRFSFKAEAKGVDLTGTSNPVDIHLRIGNDVGTSNIRLEGKLKLPKSVK